MRQLSLSQFVQIFFEQGAKKKVFCKSKHRWLCAQKIYKLRQTKLSQFVYFSLVLREREEKTTKYFTPQNTVKKFIYVIFVERVSYLKTVANPIKEPNIKYLKVKNVDMQN